jgi:PIN domain nuclease of toxin-antitoxin system
VGSDEALDSGLLREATRAAGLSLGDRLCLAAARARQARVLTADRSWAGLDVGVEIEVIR